MQVRVNLVRADGQRVRITLANSSVSRAAYHVAQVYPGHRSAQITIVARQKGVLAC